ncbi:CHAT domain-containing protein [Euryhalocaulis caribicus]|uniref:CHAT domain-containing protein n=1 Tax=Euryhalocaulis caribicus TaxID=1161401 RepID=UPI0003A70BFF|nr:CHAT domain-containing tetratricopeptide repeat protein [Euryhalocaulis caribicus]
MRISICILAVSLLIAGHALAQSADDAELERLSAAAEAIDPVQEPEAALEAWNAAYDHALAIYEPGDPRAALVGGRRVDAYFYLGEHERSAEVAREAIAALESAGPDYRAERATLIYNLGTILEQQGKTGESYAQQAAALALRREIHGEADHDDLAASLGGMAIAEYRRGEFLKARELMGEAVAMRHRMGEADGTVVALRISYAAVIRAAGDLEAAIAEALETSRLAQDILPADHPYQALVANNLAVLLQDQGRYEEAEPVIRRALDLRVAEYGRDHPYTLLTQSVLAYNLLRMGRLEEAKTLGEVSYAAYSEASGDTHADALNARSVISEALWLQRKRPQAMAIQADIVAKAVETLPAANRDRINAHDLYAEFLAGQGQFEEALTQRRAAQAGREATLPEDHHARLAGAVEIGALEARTGDTGGLDRAVAAAAQLQSQQQAFMLENYVQPLPLERARKSYASLAEAAVALGQTEIAFEAAQGVWASDAATALAKASARLAVQDSEIAALLRERQDLAERRAADLGAIVALTGADNPERMAELTESAARTEARLLAISETLAARYPDFLQLERPPVLTLAEAQAALNDGEALHGVLQTDRSVIVFALSPAAAYAGAAPGLTPDGLSSDVAALRTALDFRAPESGAGPQFDSDAAYRLYGGLFGGGAWDVVSNAGTVLSISNGTIGQLPLSILLTESPGDDGDLRGANWLIRHFNIATLPALGALNDRGGAPHSADGRFFGAGAPLLASNEGQDVLAGGLAGFYRGAGADIEAVRDLPSLPGAETELRAMSEAFGPENAALLIGADATEPAVRQTVPADASVIAFATHGLVSGELRGLAEPALVFTPPDEATAEDDGLLTASEITPLRLNADWVILSACNTAAGKSAGAPGLTGLARAFIYAGGRNLLASHWRVRDDAAARLTVETVRGQRDGLSPAESLRQAQLALMDDPDFADGWRPGVWAPFVVIGR